MPHRNHIARHLIFILIVCSSLCAALAPVRADDKAPATPQEKIEELAEAIRQEYSLKFIYKPEAIRELDFAKIHFEPVADDEFERLLAYVELFSEEVRKYPKDFFQKLELKNILFVQKLFYEERPADGLYHYPERTIMFDYFRSHGGDLTQRHNIHHEFYHMIEIGSGEWKNEEWAALNDPQFTYSKEGRWHAEQNPFNPFAPPLPGFITMYAMTSMEEDKAEVYACLFIEPQYRLMHRWAEKDEILRQKVLYMKEFLHGLSEKMDSGYWERLWQK